ncbi:MAG: mechanosensitive ion channel [Sphingomonadaceae bacterium]|nr:mechanosensitive ion channel [Sphingomonadaceae bacterium]
MNEMAASLGLDLPGPADLFALTVAAGIAAGIVFLGWLVGHFAGPRAAGYWERHAGARGERLVPRVCALVRYAIIWPALVLALRVHAWPPGAAFLLGLIAAGAAALLVRNLVRGVNLPRWVAWALALFLFVAILADAVGGLGKVTAPLDAVAFAIGSRRLSLLALVQIAIGLLALYAAVKLANRLIGQALQHAKGLDPTQRVLTQKLAALVVIAIAFFIGIDLAGIDLTALAVFSGALGLAVGFGLQKTFGNLIAGIILLMDRSIKPGDVISVGETFGQVNKIGVRAVSIVTRDGKEYLIPNEVLMTEQVVNWSYSTRDVRISIPVSIDYGCDVKLAQKLMIDAASASPRVLAAPKPNVWITKLGENGIDHEIRVWILDPEAGIGPVRSEIFARVLELFTENGIGIPSPQREIVVKSWPSEPPSAPVA